MSYSRVRRLIREAIEACSGPEKRKARCLLEQAEKELQQSESAKKEKTKDQKQKGWFFDIKTSSIRNMTLEQIKIANKTIKDMIQEENHLE